jgi:hypothetical protein
MPIDKGAEVQPTGDKVLQLDTCESIAPWAEGATGTDNLELTTTHRSGRFAIAFDKIAGGATASVSRTFADPKSLSDRAEEAKLVLRALVPDVTNVDKLHVDIGDGTNYNTYTVDDSELASGVWERVEKKITEPDAVVASGANTSSITWMQVRVVFDNAANTLADMVIDEAFVFFGASEQSTTVGADVAAIEAHAGNIDTHTEETADHVHSIDGKTPALPLTRTSHGETFTVAKTDYSPANGKWNAPGANKRLVVVGYHFSTSAAQTFSLQDEDDNEIIGTVWPPAFGNDKENKCYRALPTNKALELTTTVATDHSVTVDVETETV